MTIDEAGGKPASLQITFLAARIAITRSTHPDNEAISNGYISRITFSATHINKPGIA